MVENLSLFPMSMDEGARRSQAAAGLLMRGTSEAWIVESRNPGEPWKIWGAIAHSSKKWAEEAIEGFKQVALPEREFRAVRYVRKEE